ncbi:hypothetical protein KFK09_002503 [Dendrobium nobile]|uniref:BED-type domain-containing protein n=1 Tax=Dendrobium nobile TaxID=94219 RepID=A0A8T3C6K7_DENNO|nr:hypothetical protein KFK09_002503 [Dendrobium nobile]
MEASGTQSAASSSSVRENVDIAWNHFSEIKDAEGKRQFKCLHCGIVYKGGGINRMKQHLAGVKGNIAACKKVPHDIRFQMQENLKDISKRKQQVQEELESTPFPIDVEVDEGGDSSSLPKSQSSEAYLSELAKGKRKLAEIDTFFAPRTKSGSQPSIKSVLASKEAVHRADLAVASEVVEWVGPENIVQLVTDNAANYKKAGELLQARFNNIYWSPYAAHYLNLILKDLGSMPLIEDLAKKASKVTIFAYNHVYVLAWLRKRQGWKEIVRPGATRFATTFITLKSVCEHKHDLQALITSKFYADSKIAKTCPLIRLLCIVDSDEKPSLGYLYNGMYRAQKAIKAMFRNVKRLHKPFTKVLQGLVELLGNKDVCHKPKLAMNEVRLFRDSLESFGKLIALMMAKEMQPDEWWKMFGSSAPNLQKRRNHLEHQRLNDLVYVRYNLNLKDRFQLKKRSYDPLDYTCVEMVDFWVLDEESPLDLALEELETEIYEEASMPVVEEANIASTQPTPGELENEGDGDDIIDFNDLGAFVAADFDEAGHEDLNNEDSFHDAN